MNKKISLIGAGQIGGTLALLCLQKKLGDVVLFDISEDTAKGKALDLLQASSVANFKNTIKPTSNYKDIKNSDLIIITAGSPRKPGMSRTDLLEINNNVMKQVGEAIKKYSPKAFVICITNPLDTMVSQLYKYSGVPSNMIAGMAGVLDSSRFKFLLSKEFNVSTSQIQAYVLGGHGDSMVPLINLSNIAGRSLKDLLDQKKISKNKLDKIIEKVRSGGAEIVKLLKTGSAFYAPAYSAIEMAESFLFNLNKLLPMCVMIKNKEFNINYQMFVGVIAKIGGSGVSEILDINLSNSEEG